MIFVVYMGGCCGDVVSSLIDWKDSKFNVASRKMELPRRRQRLKTFWEFGDDTEKDRYIDEMAAEYLSLPSHDVEYHLRRGHEFLGITVTDPDIALWAAHRFRESHREVMWRHVCSHAGVAGVPEYADLMLHYSRMIENRTDKIIPLEDIVSGHALPIIEHVTGIGMEHQHTQNAYQNWQDLIHGQFII